MDIDCFKESVLNFLSHYPSRSVMFGGQGQPSLGAEFVKSLLSSMCEMY